MRCPSCACENLPVREAATIRGVMDSVVKLPEYCAQCGAVLTEQCPVCSFKHPVGTKFCQATGADLEAWRREENTWKQLVASMEATLSVRPVTCLLWVALAAFPALYFVGGFFVRDLTRTWQHDRLLSDLVIGGTLSVIATGFLTLLSMSVPMTVIGFIETERKRRLFDAQQFRTLEPTESVIEGTTAD